MLVCHVPCAFFCYPPALDSFLLHPSACCFFPRWQEFWDSQAIVSQLVGILASEKLGISVSYVHAEDAARHDVAVVLVGR